MILDDPQLGLYVPAMVWSVQYQYSHDAILLVLASDPYDADDYIRDYDEFLELLAGREGAANGAHPTLATASSVGAS